METDIYKLKLNESVTIPPELQVTRVPGGWIYRFWDPDKDDYYPNPVYVPHVDMEDTTRLSNSTTPMPRI